MGDDREPTIERLTPWRLVTLTMVVLAALHALWASGSTWPFGSRDALADTVVGRRPLPPAAATWVVVAVLVLSALAMIGAEYSGAKYFDTGSRPERDLTRAVAEVCSVILTVAAFIFAMRGVLGFITSVSGIRGSTGRYRVLDVLVYSPLSLWLAAGIYFRPQPAVGRGASPAAR